MVSMRLRRRAGARVWWAALAFLEFVYDLLDILPRKLFDLDLFLV